MSTEENKRNVVRWREEIWNNRNLNIVDELAVPEYACHLARMADPVQGREALKGLFAANLAVFDIHVTPEFLIAEGDIVAVHATCGPAKPSSLSIFSLPGRPTPKWCIAGSGLLTTRSCRSCWLIGLIATIQRGVILPN